MDGTVLGDASKSLKTMLEAAVKSVFPTSSVALDSPKDTAATPADMVVSLWLYRVTRHGDLLNLPPRRLSPNRVEAPRLPLELHYLLTPLGADTVTRQRALGVAMQAMHTNAILPGELLEPGLVAAGVAALHAHLEPHSIQELAQVWWALTEAYQLSASYVVDFVLLPAGAEPIAVSPVLDKRTSYGAGAPMGA
jgi:hypothetical protein